MRRQSATLREQEMAKYDVVVIGIGSAASPVAMPCRKAGKQVAVIDSRPFGGICVFRGCDPKKVLVGAAVHGLRMKVCWRHCDSTGRST